MTARQTVDREIAPRDLKARNVRDGRGTEATPLPWPSPSLPPGGDPTDFPPLVPFTYYDQSTLAAPALRVVSIDPDWDTEITRVNILTGQGQRYSCPMAWNKTASMLYLDYPPGGTGSNRPMLDGMTFAVLQTTSGPYGNFRWDPANEFQAFGYSNPNIMRRFTIHPTTGVITTAQSWTLSQYSEMNYTGGQGRPSNDGRYHPLTFKKSNNDWGFSVFDSQTGTVSAERVCGNSTAALGTLIDCSYMSWDGTYTIPMFETDGAGTLQGTWAFRRDNINGTGVKMSQNNSHADVCALTNGTQVMVMASQASNGSMNGQPTSGSYVGYYRMDTGAWTRLGPSGNSNLHISTANINVPGYAVISNFSTSGSQPARWNVFALELASGLIRPYCSTHKGSNSAYDAQPQATPSPSMERIAFRSDWDNGPIGCFVAGNDVIRESIL